MGLKSSNIYCKSLVTCQEKKCWRGKKTGPNAHKHQASGRVWKSLFFWALNPNHSHPFLFCHVLPSCCVQKATSTITGPGMLSEDMGYGSCQAGSGQGSAKRGSQKLQTARADPGILLPSGTLGTGRKPDPRRCRSLLRR